MSASKEQASGPISQKVAPESVVTLLKLPMSPATSSLTGVPEQYVQVDKKVPNSVVLTCEDLEQSILAEVKGSSMSLHHSIEGGRTPFEGKSDQPKADVDDLASQHLLSLLQKGTSLEESLSPPGADSIEPTDRLSGFNVNPSLDSVSDNATGRNAEKVHSSEQTLTLEALFGASFMNALHSAEAPVSAQRGSAPTANKTEVMQPHGMPSPLVDVGFHSATSRETRSDMAIHEGRMPASSNTQKDHNIPGPWAGSYSDSSIDAAGTVEGGAVDFQLPEEDSLITVGDTVNSMAIDPFSLRSAPKPEGYLPDNGNQEDVNDTIFNSIFRDAERLRMRVSDGPAELQRTPTEMLNHSDLYNHLHGRPSSHFPPQMEQQRPLFPPFDHIAHRNPQMKFAGPDGVHHDAQHPFPGNFIPHHSYSNVSAPRFDPTAAHHAMLQQMPVPGNMPPLHPMQSLPRGVSPTHPISHMAEYMPVMNNMHNFPPHNRQLGYGGSPGMGLPGNDLFIVALFLFFGFFD